MFTYNEPIVSKSIDKVISYDDIDLVEANKEFSSILLPSLVIEPLKLFDLTPTE